MLEFCAICLTLHTGGTEGSDTATATSPTGSGDSSFAAYLSYTGLFTGFSGHQWISSFQQSPRIHVAGTDQQQFQCNTGRSG
uniref:Putative secreted protein n=1 Tax=Anopheles triannulatus TaxID=58253 RepID=A0A2M4B3S4_9DIPT